jgi:hypothetical protein
MNSKAWRALSAAQLRIYIAIASHKGKSGRCFPGIKRLAILAQVTERTAQAAVTKLCEVGLLHRQSGGGRKKRNHYRLINPVEMNGVSAKQNPVESQQKPRRTTHTNPVGADGGTIPSKDQQQHQVDAAADFHSEDF